jgi:hypothetical protein
VDWNDLNELTDHFTDEQIAELYGLSRGRLSTIRRELGVLSYRDKRIPSRDDLDELCKTHSDLEIAEMLDCSRAKVFLWRQEYGIPSYRDRTGNCKKDGQIIGPDEVMRNARAGIKNPYVTPEVNTGWVTYFDKLDSPDKAYFLGWLATDGSVSKKTCRLALQLGDKEILYSLKSFVGCPGDVVEKPNDISPSAIIYLNSTYLVRQLESWGVVQNKSHILKILKAIPQEFESDFVRGCWDGDGTIGKDAFALSSSSPVFRRQIQEIIRRNTGCTLTNSDKYNYLRGCRGSTKAIQWIYSRNPVLHRKAIKVSRFFG